MANLGKLVLVVALCLSLSLLVMLTFGYEPDLGSAMPKELLEFRPTRPAPDLHAQTMWDLLNLARTH